MSGIFPDDWKCARVAPLFKQGESSDLNNYWPTSVISVVAKVFERIVYDQLYNFLNGEEIISKTIWFPASTLNCYCTSRSHWELSVDYRSWLRQCRSVCRLKERHSTLLIMRYYYLKWIDVEFKVKLLIGLNCIWQIAHNVAQLTVVSLTSPLLHAVYLIYINDLSNCLLFSIPRMYADDTHITYAGSDLHLIQSSLSHDVEKLSNWLVSDRLTLNTTKTEFMLIGSRQRSSTLSDTLELSIDNIPIKQVSSVKSLGIYIEENST